MIYYLLNISHKKDIADMEGNTILHYAVKGNNSKIVKLLLQNGYTTNKANKKGQTAYDLSLSLGLNSITQLLEDNGIKPKFQ